MEFLTVTGSSRSGTTLTTDMVRYKNNDMLLTNEFRTFWFLNDYKSAPTYFKALYDNFLNNGGNKGYHRLPNNVNMKKFNEICYDNLIDDTIEGRLLSVCKFFGAESLSYFGDKGTRADVLLEMEQVKSGFKKIYIYRDGRDVVSSGVQHKRGLNPPWSNSPFDNSKHWADNIESFLNIKDLLTDIIVIKFEDYVTQPEKNINLIADHLSTDINKLKEAYSTLLDTNKTHTGYYKDICPDWRTTFHPKAINILERLNYI